jgi:hypothetical protein
MNKVEKVYPTIEKVWEYVKRNFRKGKDYIETETDEYIVFCPFNYLVLSFFDDAFRHFDTSFYFQHCVAQQFGAFGFWYNMIYRDGMLKTFFIRKDTNLGKNNWDYAMEKDFLVEFTGWISLSDRNFLHFAHLVNNEFVTGDFSFSSKETCNREHAMSRKVAKGYKEIVDKMNSMVNEVYDDLFAQYDVHVEELEETLHNILDE